MVDSDHRAPFVYDEIVAYARSFMPATTSLLKTPM